MKIKLESQKECDILRTIIGDFEDGKVVKRNKTTKGIISDLRSAINLFYIDRMDKIGPMICKFCDKEWTAVFSNKTKTLSCPSCKKHNVIPQLVKEK